MLTNFSRCCKIPNIIRNGGKLLGVELLENANFTSSLKLLSLTSFISKIRTDGHLVTHSW